MEKTNRKKTGFTLIELLVVIVIIGILSTISTATFKSYFGKARDAERQAAVQNIALMIKVEGATDSNDTKFIYDANDTSDTPPNLNDIFKENDFRIPKGSNNICYVLGVANGTNDQLGEDNDFFVATWGESTSTKITGAKGVLVDGTEKPVNAILAINTLAGTDFACAGGFAKLRVEGVQEASNNTKNGLVESASNGVHLYMQTDVFGVLSDLADS